MPITVTPKKTPRHRGRSNGSTSSSSMGRNSAEYESPQDSYKTRASPRGGYSPNNIVDSIPILGTPQGKQRKEALIKPRTVTPLPTFRTAVDSWEDFDEIGFGSKSNGARRGFDRGSASAFSQSSPVANRQFPISSSFEDDDEMPMDELMDSANKLAKKPMAETSGKASPRSIDFGSRTSPSNAASNNIGKMIEALESNTVERPDGLNLEERMLWDLIKSTVVNATRRGKLEAAASSSDRETELEIKLNESKSYIDQLNQKLRRVNVDQTVVAASEASTKRINQLEEQLRVAQTDLKKKESEHDAELRAIQRVLAELTTEREEETQVLNETVATLAAKVQQLEHDNQELQNGMSSSPSPSSFKKETVAPRDDSQSKEDIAELDVLKATVKELETEKQSTVKDLDRKSRRLMILERDYKVLKVQLKKVEDEKKQLENVQPMEQVKILKSDIEKLRERNQKLQVELDAANKERKARRKTLGSMTPPRPETTNHTDVESVSSSMSAEDIESLQKSLSETTSSLENAKKIIASLENANGSMAVDLRAKLKAKEEELVSVQKESAERKRRLDGLATELRDLQKKHADIELLETQSKTQIIRHKALMGLLEKSVSGLQAASAVHEVATATGDPDQSNVDQISEILNDTMVGIRTSLDLSEQFMDEYDDTSTVAFTDVDVSSDVGRQIDAIIKNDREAMAKNMKDELEQKRIAVRRLEEALQMQTEEMRRMRFEQKCSDDNRQLLAEIKNLREECSKNKELLAQKERELSVLRSTFNLDENDAGYISDDASDGEEDDEADLSASRLNSYSPEQSALATLLAAGGNMPSQDSDWQKELLNAINEKEKAARDLKAERESLANAKLIISSLEKANKSMMEDLRSRLQDSNSAIASLLDKSSEHEKNSKTLKEEVEKLRKEKEQLLVKMQKEIPKMKEAIETNSSSLIEEKKEDTADEVTTDDA